MTYANGFGELNFAALLWLKEHVSWMIFLLFIGYIKLRDNRIKFGRREHIVPCHYNYHLK